MAKQGDIDLEIVKKLVQNTGIFPVGSFVHLSNGDIARVIGSNGMSLDRPTVAVVFDKENNLLSKDELVQINLKKETTIRIENPVNIKVDAENLMTGF